MLTPWNRRGGTQQGCIVPTGATPLDGTRMFCLGHDVAGREEEIENGAYALVEQTATVITDGRLLQVRAFIRPPASVPSGCYWIWEVLLGGTLRASYRLVPGGVAHLRTLSVNTANITGSQLLTIRLRFRQTGESDALPAAAFECGP